MEYNVQKLAELAGVTPRTLRHYDSIGLLKPKRVDANGYRVYSVAEVDRLQQILFYRELGFGLGEIATLLDDPGFDDLAALRQHRQRLLARRDRIDALLDAVDQTIKHKEGLMNMSDEKKFEAFKQGLIDENERKYGEEVRQKYGDSTVDASNAKMMNMTEQQFKEMQQVEQRMVQLLTQAMNSGDATSELAQQAAGLHKQWLGFTWGSYSPEAHCGLVQMYVDDPRFSEYYDQYKPGMAQFLRDAVLVFTQR